MRKPKLQFFDFITGLSYRGLLLLWVTLVIFFALAYTGLHYVDHHGPTPFVPKTQEMPIAAPDVIYIFLNNVYFSIITATSTGYGDIVPHGFSKILASIQSIISLMVFAVFVTKLVSNRQEIALREVHKLTFEDIFHNTREELYIARKDFDHIMQKVHAEGEIDAEDWANLTIAYRQVTSILQEIPDFYDGINNLYTIDARREELLQESVHRTLHRINQLLDCMSKNGIDWISREASITELRELLTTSAKVTKLWRRKSPYQKQEAFEQILHLTESVHARMREAFPVEGND